MGGPRAMIEALQDSLRRAARACDAWRDGAGPLGPADLRRLEAAAATVAELLDGPGPAGDPGRSGAGTGRERPGDPSYRSIFENSPVAMVEQDLSGLQARFERLRAEGVADLQAWLDADPGRVRELAGLVRITAVNAACLELYGAPSAQAFTDQLPSHLPEESPVTFRAELQVLFQGGLAFEHEIASLDFRGRPLAAHLRLTVVPGHERDLDMVVVSLADLSAQKAAESERLRMEKEIEHLQRLESLGRLASGVSHDMNNLLATIMGVASILELRFQDQPDLLKDARLLLRAADRGKDLVKGLRDFSRKELDAPGLLDLNALVRTEVDLLARTTLRRVEVAVDLEEGLPPVYGESGTLANAILNLAVNAIDAMAGGGRLTLRTRRLHGGRVELAVEDDGAGMAPEVLARAMEPFFTTKPAGQGTGLGLSQVYGTMKAHGGTLQLDSRPGAGTRAALVFPPAPGAEPAPDPPEPGPAAPGRSLRILLVDDEPVLLETVAEMLRLLGHRVETAGDGQDCVARIRAGLPVDLVILDNHMPVMDGVDALAALRRHRPRLPVLFATGSGDDRVAALLDRFPDLRICHKPFTLNDLGRVLAGWP